MKFREYNEAVNPMLRGRKEMPSALGIKGQIGIEDAQYMTVGDYADVYMTGTGEKTYVKVLAKDSKSVTVQTDTGKKIVYKLVDNGTMQ